MVLKASQERVKTLLKDTITLLCKNGLEFKDNFTVEAIIGVTLDNDEVMLISMNEIVKSDGAAKVSLDDELSKDLSTSDIGNGTTKKVSETHRKRKRSRSPSSKLCPVKIEPRSPEHADNSLTNFNPKAEDLWAGGNPPSLSPSALDDATAEPSLLEQKNEHSALGGFLSNPGSIEQGAEEYDETGEGEFDNDGEDIVFIKEEALSDGTPSSYGQSSGFPQQSSSYSGDTGMTWAQQTPHSFQSRRSGPRLPHTSTATSSTSDMQNSQSDTQPNTSMQGSQQQSMMDDMSWALYDDYEEVAGSERKPIIDSIDGHHNQSNFNLGISVLQSIESPIENEWSIRSDINSREHCVKRRQKLLSNPEYLKTEKDKNRHYSKQYRKALDAAGRELYNAKARVRMAKYRERLKASGRVVASTSTHGGSCEASNVEERRRKWTEAKRKQRSKRTEDERRKENERRKELYRTRRAKKNYS